MDRGDDADLDLVAAPSLVRPKPNRPGREQRENADCSKIVPTRLRLPEVLGRIRASVASHVSTGVGAYKGWSGHEVEVGIVAAIQGLLLTGFIYLLGQGVATARQEARTNFPNNNDLDTTD